jgi:NADPH:quinone reductase-like Zn-dependent oxidoreductase
MRSAMLTADGLQLVDRPKPAVKGTEILVRVHAVSLNRRDTLILDGLYSLPAAPGVIPISDGAGEVVAVGERVTRFKVGDRVMGSYWTRWYDGRLRTDQLDQLGCTVDGMLTELAVLDEQAAVTVPEHLTWAEAATLPCAGLTAWAALTEGAPLLPGQTVLTLGSGNVSLFALKYGKLLGCRVIVTTSSEAKAERLLELGADHVVNYAAEPRWGQAVQEMTGGGADLVVETVGVGTLDQSIRAAARYSEVVLLGAMAGGHVEVSGEAYGRSLATIRRVFVGNRAALERMSLAVAAGRVRPVIDRTFGFEEALDAIEYYRQGKAFGKVIISLE